MLKKYLFVVFALLMILSSTVVNAGKIFKWTDEQGNVHFGQRPPSGENKAVAVRGAQSSVRPLMREGDLYCGKIKVQYKSRYRSNKRYKQKKHQVSAYDLEKKISNWRRSLKHSKNDLNRYLIQISKINPNRSSRYSRSRGEGFYERKDKLNKSIAEYTCAIDWAEEKVLALKLNSSSERDNYKKATKDLKSARNQQLEICGIEPSSYNEYGEDRDRYRAWEKCQRKYGSVVRRMERNFRKAKNELNDVN